MKLHIYLATALAAGLLSVSGAHAQRADPAAADSVVPATRYVAELAPAPPTTMAPPPQQWRALNRLVGGDEAMAPVADEKTMPAPATAPADPDAHPGHPGHHQAGGK